MPGQHPTDYHNFGLRHGVEELQIAWKIIHRMPIEEQAKYADAVCRANIRDDLVLKDFRRRFYKAWALKQVLRMHNWNATSVGNIAYVALHAEDEAVRTNAKYLLELFNDYRNKAIGV